MPKVNYGGQSYECDGQSVLDCLTAQGVAIPSSCHSGVCQTCMMRVVEGDVPERAKTGLKATLAAQNYFLPCSCYPESDITVALSDVKASKIDATITDLIQLNKDILGIKLKPKQPFKYKAGQFINFFKDDATARCYSLASVPEVDQELFLNVRKVPNGLVTSWIFSNLGKGDEITISEATGDCFYVLGKPEQNILLIGTGSGLAPLYGIVRDALLNGHKGVIKLYHGSYDVSGFYLVKELKHLEREYKNFEYVQCVSDGEVPEGYSAGMVADVALEQVNDLTGWRVFLCGNPNMVNSAKQQTFLAGASMSEIFADPF